MQKVDFLEYGLQRRRSLGATALIFGGVVVFYTGWDAIQSHGTTILTYFGAGISIISGIVAWLAYRSADRMQSLRSVQVLSEDVSMDRLRQDPQLRRRLSRSIKEIVLIRSARPSLNLNSAVILREDTLSAFSISLVAHNDEAVDLVSSEDESMIETNAVWLANQLGVRLVDARFGVPVVIPLDTSESE
jgi:hypothetical protein